MENAGAYFVLGLMGLIALTGVAAIYVKVILPAQYRARRAAAASARAAHPYAAYVAPPQERNDDEANVPENSAFERAERPQNVQPVQEPNGENGLSADDITRIDAAARMLAAGLTGEAAAIELLFDGVKRGSSKRYVALRDGVRIVALRHGWKPPEKEPPPPEARKIPISDGKAGYVEV